jgi:hypothetical protein
LFQPRIFRGISGLCATALFAVALSVSARAEDPFFSSSPVDAAPVYRVPAGPQDGGEAKPKKSSPLGALGIGWTYIYADVGAGERESINGWYARPSINIPHHLSLFADFTNYYGTTKKGSLNSHGDTFGVAYQYLRLKKIKSSVFGEAGVVRTSNAGVTNQFAFNAGFNLSIPINKHMDFTMTPAEWIFLYPKGDPRNDYNAKVGISFPFGKR